MKYEYELEYEYTSFVVLGQFAFAFENRVPVRDGYDIF